MFICLYRRLRGYITVKSGGHHIERFLNILCNRQIHIWDVKESDGCIWFNMWAKDFFHIKEPVKRTKVKVTIEKKSGLPFVMNRFRGRYGLFLGFFTGWLIVNILTCFLWNIEIKGNMYYSNDELLKFLNQNNIKIGIKKGTIDFDKIEKSLRNGFDHIKWASVQTEGTVLTIHIRENTIDEICNSENEGLKGTNIVADCDATIEKMVTRSGTPRVRAGDEVKKGDILVEGNYQVIGDDMSVVDTVNVIPGSDIYGKVIYSINEEILSEYEKKVYTGRIYEYTDWFFKDRYFSTKYDKAVEEFKKYDIITKEKQGKLSSNIYIPLIKKNISVKEYDVVKMTYSEQEMKKKAEDRLDNILKKIKEKTIQIISKDVKIEGSENKYRIYGDIIAIEQIGVYGGTNE